jgi:uroporphyrinogen-III synthase
MPTILFCRSPAPPPNAENTDVDPDEASSRGQEELKQQDPYNRLFSEHGFDCIFVPVIERALQHQDQLKTLFERSPDSGCLGIIITSKMAATALQNVWETLHEKQATLNLWRDLKFYQIGTSSVSIVEGMGFKALGSDCGRAEELADYIIENSKVGSNSTALAASSSPYFLFLCGDKRLGILPAKLKEAGLLVKEQPVYGTTLSTRFSNELEDILLIKERSIDWVVFFSPSGVDVALDVITARQASGCHQLTDVRFATIGPTTSNYIHTQSNTVGLKIEVKAVASKPNPQALLDSIKEASPNLFTT